MPNDTADRKPGNRRAFTRDQYDRMLHYFRARPGDVAGAAQAAGVSVRTAQKTWAGPPRPLYPWAEPIEAVLRREDAERMAQTAAEEAKRLMQHEQRVAEEAKLDAERRRIDRDVLRVARADVLNGLTSLLKMQPAVDTLVLRTVEFVKRGTDAAGNAIDVSIKDVMTILGRYSAAVARLADAASSIAAVDEIRKQLPPTLVQVNIGGNVTLEEAQAELAEANEALERAQRLHLLGKPIMVEAEPVVDDVAGGADAAQ